ncbi:MAG: NAD(P)/FAD-dependent oxidoreductase [Oscillospiraceae bacterium]|nr:NAD(P)/FAD-dependent oxidoreductase [Oscillospiraceae bacterium]
MDRYDLAILGGGPAGYIAAEQAASGGLKTVLFEADKLGGVCLNEGCIPTKVMLNSSKLLYYAKTGVAYGVLAKGVDAGGADFSNAKVGSAEFGKTEFHISQSAVLARKEKAIKTLTAGVRSKLSAAGVDIVFGKAEISGSGNAGVGRGEIGGSNGGGSGGNNSSGNSGGNGGSNGSGNGGGADRGGGYIVTQTTGDAPGRQVQAARVLIATGSSPIVPPVGGVGQALESGFAITSREALSLADIPKKLVIVGGGIIGLELADYFNAAGADVTIVEMLDRVAFPMEAETSKILMGHLRKRGVAFKLGHRLSEFVPPGMGDKNGESGKIIIEQTIVAGAAANSDSPSKETLPADTVLIAVGRRPNVSGIGLENIGVHIERGAIVTDDHMRTNVPGVYAAGDVNGKYMLAHTAYREACCAVSNMLGKPDKMRYDAIPSVIYTNPEAAGVGETEESAAAKGLQVKTVKLPLRYSGRYIAEVEGGDGICKVLFDARKSTIIGAHIVGTYASEIIMTAVAMMESQRPAEALRGLVFPHPTVGEILREALFAYK